jgi:hypothetical protein
MEKFKLKRLPWLAFAAAVMVLPGIRPAQAAKPKPNSCPLMIAACGCVITHADTYLAVNDLSAAQTQQPNCIEIAASNAILNLNGVHVDGNGDGTGIGILIRKGADNVIVEGGIQSNNTPAANPAAGVEPMGQATVNLWNIGIEDDGNNAIIALFSRIGGNFFGQNGNSTAGVFLNGVKDSFIGIINASFNSKFGVLLRNSTGVTLANFSAGSNKETGLKFESSSDSSVGPGGAEGNGKYGMWLMSSSRNTIHDSNGNMSNGDTGILLSDGSNENRITNAGAPRNMKAGIVIQLGSMDNTVTITHNEDNGGTNSDMVDLNPNCDNNVWYNNVGFHNQSCIQ